MSKEEREEFWNIFKSGEYECHTKMETFIENKFISKDKIKEKQKELEEQKEKLKYDGNRCFADYEQFCKNLKFFNEQIEELLEEK